MKNKIYALFAITFAIAGLLSSSSESFAQVSNSSPQVTQGAVTGSSSSPVNGAGSPTVSPSGQAGFQPNNLQTNSQGNDSLGNVQGGILANATNGSNNQTVTIAAGTGSAGANGTCVGANNCFDPHNTSVQPGASVTWRNDDNVLHTVTSGKSTDADAGKLFDKNIPAGQSVSIQFNNTGTIDYFCKVHPWMSGQVTVGSGNGNSSNSQGGIIGSNGSGSTTGVNQSSGSNPSPSSSSNGSSNGKPSPSGNFGNNVQGSQGNPQPNVTLGQ